LECRTLFWKENSTNGVATARRENGHTQDTQTGTEIWAKGEEKHRTPKEKMEGPASL
jgi:hypothetical protein